MKTIRIISVNPPLVSLSSAPAAPPGSVLTAAQRSGWWASISRLGKWGRGISSDGDASEKLATQTELEAAHK